MRRTRIVIALSAAILLLLASVGPASAHFLGGRWSWTDGSSGLLDLSYQNQAGAYPAYSSAIDTAANNWYATPTPLNPYSTAGAANITVDTTYDTSSSYWGITHIYTTQCVLFICWNPEISYQACGAPCAGSDYTSATFTLNRATLDSESDFIRLKVATHEFGHTFGLGHAYSPDCTSIMQQGYLAFNTPQAHDSYDIDQLYPSSVYSAAYAC